MTNDKTPRLQCGRGKSEGEFWVVFLGPRVPIESTHGFTFKGHVGRGPSGSGKSTLARALVGVRPRLRGKIKLDKAALERWSLDALGKHIG